MDGYDAVMRIAEQKPEYVSILEKCAKAHRMEQKKQYCLGFQWHEVEVQPSILLTLCTKYDFLTVTHKTNKKTYSMVNDIDGVEKALQDIGTKTLATYDRQGVELRIRLSRTTWQKLRNYLAREFTNQWAAEDFVIERALNLFLDTEGAT